MKKIKNIKKNRVYIFVVFSLFIFFVSAAFYFWLNLNMANKNNFERLIVNNADLENNNSGDKLYLKEEYDNSDPYITKVPRLKDMIRGPIITAADPSQGNLEAPVTIVIFSDFKCQYCFNQEQVLKKIKEKNKDSIRLIWKDYPEKDVHSESYEAAVAARCAQKQGVFWQFHDYLYDNSGKLSSTEYYRIAEQLKLDIKKFKNCFEGSESAHLVNDDIEEANALNIGGIPFIYVNDKEIIGEIEEAELQKIIQDEIDKN